MQRSTDTVEAPAQSDAPPLAEPTGHDIATQAKWLAAGQVVADGAFYGAIVVLAALVPPVAFGTVAAGMAIIRIAAIVMESGTGGAIIAARDLTVEQARRVAVLNVAIGALLSLGIALAAGPMAAVLASGGEEAVLRVLGLALTLQALTIVPVALLRKAMEFRRYAKVNSISAFSTAVIAVGAGLLGAGVWALVVRQMLFPALLALLAWREARPIARSLPHAAGSVRLRRAPRGVRGFLVVGAAGLLTMTLDNLLVGAVTDARQLAFYALSFTLGFAPLTLISWRLGQVLFPAAAATTDRRLVGRRTAHAMRLAALLLCPLLPVAVALAPATIPTVLGPDWTGMVVPFEILLLVGITHAVANMVGESLSGTGNIGFRARIDVPWAAATLVGVVILGQIAGIRGAAAAHLVTVAPLCAAYAVVGSRRIGTGPLELWRAMRGVLVPAGAQAGVTLGVLAVLQPLPLMATGAIAAIAGLTALAVGLCLAPSRPLGDLWAVLRMAFGGPERAPSEAEESQQPIGESGIRASAPASPPPEPGTAARGARLHGIEGLRALAATSIVLLHCWQYSGPRGPVSLGPMTQLVLRGLPLGVTLFFTLSGFLLYAPFAAALIRGEPRPSFGRYVRRRALRILPAYWAILLLVALLLGSALVWDPAGHARPAHIHDAGLLARNLLLIQAYDPRTVLTGIGPAWSLAVEAVFYVALPLLVLIAAWLARAASSRSGRRRAALVPAGVLLAVGISGKLVAGLIVTSGHGWDPTWHSVIERSFWGQADLFTFGVALAVLRTEVEDGRARLPPWWRKAAWAGIVGIALASGLVSLGLHEYAYGTLVGLAFALLLALVVLPGEHAHPPWIVRVLESRPFVATGVISYSLFLWNDPVTRWLGAHGLTLPGPVGLIGNIALIAALSWAVAGLTYRCVERPAMHWRRSRGARPRPSSFAAEQLEAAP